MPALGTGKQGCDVEGCERPHKAHGFCRLHDRRMRDYGSTADPRPATTTDLFWSKVEKSDGCWTWKGGRSVGRAAGYGNFFISRQVPHYQAHRYSYELHHGAIPDGYVIDHLCRNPSCVRPDHLEPVDPRTNVIRGVSPFAQRARQTHCVNGHEFTPENTRLRRDGNHPTRICRACEAIRRRAWNAKQKVA